MHERIPSLNWVPPQDDAAITERARIATWLLSRVAKALETSGDEAVRLAEYLLTLANAVRTNELDP